MNDTAQLVDAVAGIVSRRMSSKPSHITDSETFDDELWSDLSDGGFTWISVPESVGGSGGSLADAAAVVRTVARSGASLPIAETTLVAGWLISAAGVKLPSPLVTSAVGHSGDAVSLTETSAGWTADLRLHRVPWARHASHVTALVPLGSDNALVLIPTADVTVTPGHNLAGEPRDTVTATGVQLDAAAVSLVGDAVDLHRLRLRGALARTVAMAGAMEAASTLTTLYASQREQFGRAIAAFQAVQHHLVVLASEASAASMAADLATAAYEGGDPEFAVPAAKIQAGVAAAAVTAAAHQVHGAIGMTQEYQLHRHTRALWAWRQEFGSEAWWSDHLGERVCGVGADNLWPLITNGRFDR